MSLELKMPALSPTMEKGTLARWLVAVGDVVKAGDMIAEIETDKATMEFEAVDEGRIDALLVPAGSADVKVGTVIALLGAGEEGDMVETPAPQAATKAKADSAPMSAPAPKATAAPVVSVTPTASPTRTETVLATPLVYRLASIHGIALKTITGSGPRGKIVRADLGLDSPRVAILAPLAPAASAAPSAVEPPPEGVPVDSQRLSEMRKTIARRLTLSKQTVPHFYLTARCVLDPILELRARINTDLAASGVKVSVNDMLVKAMARAMQQVPEVNVQFGGDCLHHFGRVDIAMAVAIEGGLVTPVIRDAGTVSLSAIATQSKTLAEKARGGKLLPEEYRGGTASISNLGMFGVDEMFPVLNPPQALILGVGAGVEQPWKVGGEIALATVIALTASFDHRAIDGAVAAQFMSALRESVERPMLLLC